MLKVSTHFLSLTARAVHADHYPTVYAYNHYETSTPDVRTEGLGSEVAKLRIDEIAKVTRPIISPSHSHHTSVLGACAWEPKARGKEENEN